MEAKLGTICNVFLELILCPSFLLNNIAITTEIVLIVLQHNY